MKLIRLILFPISILYGFILRIRNLAYDIEIIKSYEANIPTICFGNLSMGGTGKTPHTKFLIDKLADRNIVVLSRGYGRKTTGFLWVETNSMAKHVGDEPLEIKRHYPKIKVAVCENRVEGIKQIQKEFPNTELVILDDAYQHRKLKCSCYILLTTYSNPFYKDFIVPTGYLRDNRAEAKRAAVTIVTKSPIEQNNQAIIKQLIGRYTKAPVCFSHLKYADILPSLNSQQKSSISDLANKNIILLTGLANPTPFVDFWKSNANVIHHFNFPDHHDFTSKDLLKLRQIFDSFANQEPIVITTEKDSMRLEPHMLSTELQNVPIFVSKMAIAIENEAILMDIINNHISTFNYVE
jgi:tetraacyldisaccharide 4'-kinase